MSLGGYNGYTGKQRMAILKAYKRGDAGPDFSFAEKPCGLCGDPHRKPTEWHSEDYSQPFTYVPPQTYPMCSACHGRLHKRFNASPAEWELFCRHIEAGGYGREFATLYPVKQRAALCERLLAGKDVIVSPVRTPPGFAPWWRDLTLDPESLEAPWARPRPWRPRPDAAAFATALNEIALSESDRAMLACHAAAPRRTATMRAIANAALGQDGPSTANLLYGTLAKRLCATLDWTPDFRSSGAPIWMSVVAEGWQPPAPREYEWVMVPTLAAALAGRKGDRP